MLPAQKYRRLVDSCYKWEGLHKLLLLPNHHRYRIRSTSKEQLHKYFLWLFLIVMNTRLTIII
jgi:hypothetical protein